MRFDVGYWNGGQRPAADLRAAWTALLSGEHTGHPLAALALSEVADQTRVLQRFADREGYGLTLGHTGVPDGRKSAILWDPGQLDPVGRPSLDKVGDTFQGRRSGRADRVRMGNKYILSHEFRHLGTGWTPIIAVTHVWPSVTRNAAQVRALVNNIADWTDVAPGTLLLLMDANMGPENDLLRPLRGTRLACSQVEHGPEGTWGRRPIDMGWVRESGHYKMTGQTTVRLPGRERNGKPGHKAVVVHGKMTKRRGWTR